MVVTKIINRRGQEESFDKAKIAKGVFSAAKRVGGTNEKTANEIADKVANRVNEKFSDAKPPSTWDVNNMVEYELIHGGHVSTLKSYITYRYEKSTK